MAEHNGQEVHLEDLEYDGAYGEAGHEGYDHEYDEEYYDEGNYDHGQFHEGHEGGYFDEEGNWYAAVEGEGHEGYGDEQYYYEDDEYHDQYQGGYSEGHEGEYHDYGHGYDANGNEVYNDEPIYDDEDAPIQANHPRPSSSSTGKGPGKLSRNVSSSSGSRAQSASKGTRRLSNSSGDAIRVQSPPTNQQNLRAQQSQSGSTSHSKKDAPVKVSPPPSAVAVSSSSGSKPANPSPNIDQEAVIRVPVNGQRKELSSSDKVPVSSSRKKVNSALNIETGVEDAKPVLNNFRSPVVVRLGDGSSLRDSSGNSPASSVKSSAKEKEADSRPSTASSVKSNKVVPLVSPYPTAAIPVHGSPAASRSAKGSQVAPISPPLPTVSSSTSGKTPAKTPPPPQALEAKPDAEIKTFETPTAPEKRKLDSSSSGVEDSSGSDVSSGTKKIGTLVKMLSGTSKNSFNDVGGVKRRRCYSGNKKTNSFLNATCITATGNPMVFVASADSSTYVFDAMSGDQVHTMTGHSDRVLCLASSVPGEVYFSKGVPAPLPGLHGKHFIISGGRDENLCIWDADSFKNLHTIHAHKGPVWSVAAVVIGEVAYAVSSSSSGSIRIWDASSGAKIYNLKGQKGKVLSLYVLDRRAPLVCLLSCGEDKNIHVWDIVAGRHIKLLEGHEEEVTSVAAGNFQQLASMQSIEVATKATMKTSNKLITLIVSGSRDKSVRVWDFEQGIALFVLGGHMGAIFGVSIAVTLRQSIKTAVNTPIVISGSEDGAVILWSLETGKPIKEIKGHVNSIKGLATSLVEATPGVYDREMLVVTCGWDKTVHFFDVDDSINTEDSGFCKCSIM